MTEITRRGFLRAGALGAASAAAGLRFGIDAAHASGIEARWASLSPGFTLMVTKYIIAKHLDEKNGLKLGEPTNYTSVGTYYQDFVAGTYDVCIGTWDTFAARYLAGVPVQLVCTITTGDMINMIAPAGGANNVKELAGKTLATLQSSGTYRLTKALLKENQGIDLEKFATVQNVDNPAAAATLVMANRADAALTWEPNVSTAISKVPGIKVIFNAGEEYRSRTGLDLPYFAVAIRRELAARNPGVAQKVNKAFADCLAGINANIDEAVAIGGAGTRIPPEVLKMAMSSKRLQFKHGSVSDPAVRKSVLLAAEMLQRNGGLSRKLDDAFFAAA